MCEWWRHGVVRAVGVLWKPREDYISDREMISEASPTQGLN